MTPNTKHSRSDAHSLRSILLTAIGAITVAGCAPVEDTGTSVDEVHRVCATATSVRGIDVSIYQGTVDWAAAARGGVEFAIIRHSHGSTIDTNFTRNWNGARAAGIIHGAYQYFNPWTDPTTQANSIVSGLRAVGFGPGDLPPTLDVEQPRGAGDPPLPSPADYATRVRTWVGVIRTRLGVEPIIYTGGYYWDANVNSAEFRALPLWHAQYFNYPDTIYNLNSTLPNGGCPTSVSNAWTRWSFWQFAGGNGRAPGVAGPVDLDVFNGTMTQLRALARVPLPDAGTPDAGALPDTGLRDAAIPRDVTASPDAMGSDGGTSDGAVPGDDVVVVDSGATVDSGVPAADGAVDAASGDVIRGDVTGGDAGTMAPSGCACRTAGGRGATAPPAFLLAGLAALRFASRRRTRGLQRP